MSVLDAKTKYNNGGKEIATMINAAIEPKILDLIKFLKNMIGINNKRNTVTGIEKKSELLISLSYLLIYYHQSRDVYLTCQFQFSIVKMIYDNDKFNSNNGRRKDKHENVIFIL
ncbi:UDP-N-acetylglucosamine 1-carboxyvinyltransferase [Dirofilaria immitis]